MLGGTWFLGVSLLVSAVMLTGCGGQNSPNQGETIGQEQSAKTKTLETGAAVIQDTTPVKQLEVYLNGFHPAAHNPGDQMEAHHYCEQVNEDLHQCVLYDGNGENALMIGMEHIVSDRVFKTLPPEEQKRWHPHYYEVGSGALIAPGLPDAAEHALMEEIYTTHGKTWHIWDTRKHEVPMGEPMLMLGFTQDGQMKPGLTTDRDRRFGVDTAKKREQRADIPWEKRSGQKH